MSEANDRSGQRAPASGTRMGSGGAAPECERSSSPAWTGQPKDVNVGSAQSVEVQHIHGLSGGATVTNLPASTRTMAVHSPWSSAGRVAAVYGVCASDQLIGRINPPAVSAVIAFVASVTLLWSNCGPAPR